VKIKVIHGLIQIECPFNWAIEKITKTANEIKWTVIYNAKKLNKLDVSKPKLDLKSITYNKWKLIPRVS
jgi:hypothetical protein